MPYQKERGGRRDRKSFGDRKPFGKKPYLTNYFKQLKMIKLFLKTLTDSNVSYTLNSYRAELFAVEFIEEIIQRLKLKEFLSSGLEQTLGTIQETHEQFCYLLKQQTRETSMPMKLLKKFSGAKQQFQCLK
jgi:hypothetical protein